MSEFDPSSSAAPEAAPATPARNSSAAPLVHHMDDPATLLNADAEPYLAAPAAPPKPTLHRLFLGDDGLRAGWSFALFILLILLIGAALNVAIAHFHLLPQPVKGTPQKPITPRGTALGDGLNFAALTLAAFLMSLIERRPFALYGLSLRRAAPDLLIGILWGLAAMSGLIGILYVTHSIAFDGLALHGATALLFGAKWALAFLCVGLAEEFLTRGYIQYTVARGVAGITRAMDPGNSHAHAIGFTVAALLFSVLLFMAGHLRNAGETGPGILVVGLAGATFAFSLWRTGTLWWAIGLHAAWDWAQSFFYGVSDSGLPAAGHLLNSHPMGRAILSGGATGPEGSLFAIPTLLGVMVVIYVTLPMRRYPLTPDQASPAGPYSTHQAGYPAIAPDHFG